MGTFERLTYPQGLIMTRRPKEQGAKVVAMDSKASGVEIRQNHVAVDG